jgi:hypothetical protein
MAISNKITVTRTIALVDTLARLHNFCLEELNPDQMEIDTENILIGRMDMWHWRILICIEFQCQSHSWMQDIISRKFYG